MRLKTLLKIMNKSGGEIVDVHGAYVDFSIPRPDAITSSFLNETSGRSFEMQAIPDPDPAVVAGCALQWVKSKPNHSLFLCSNSSQRQCLSTLLVGPG